MHLPVASGQKCVSRGRAHTSSMDDIVAMPHGIMHEGQLVLANVETMSSYNLVGSTIELQETQELLLYVAAPRYLTDMTGGIGILEDSVCAPYGS